MPYTACPLRVLSKGAFLSRMHPPVLKPDVTPSPFRGGEQMEQLNNGESTEDSTHKGPWLFVGVGCLSNSCRPVGPERGRRLGVRARSTQEGLQKESVSDAKEKKKK